MELDYQIAPGEVFRHEWGVYSGVDQSIEGDGVIVKVGWIVATFHVFPAVCPDEILPRLVQQFTLILLWRVEDFNGVKKGDKLIGNGLCIVQFLNHNGTMSPRSMI